MKPLLILLATTVIAGWGGLVASDFGILVAENRLEPRDNYLEKSAGNTPRNLRQAKLACRYFDGWRVRTVELWHSASKVGGIQACPFILAVKQ